LDLSRSSQSISVKHKKLFRRGSTDLNCSFGRRSSIEEFLDLQKEKQLFIKQTNLFQHSLASQGLGLNQLRQVIKMRGTGKGKHS
jgi:23S rRNA A1618 N6-methylase RlmF